jgi:predicted CoA-binding protein
LGRKVYAALKEIPHAIDMVDIFRNSQAALGITHEALALAPLPDVIWMQLGVRNDQAAALAEAKGVKVVMNRCPKMEYGKLSGEWAWVGGYSGLISSRRQRLHESGKLQSLGLGTKR